MESLYRFIPEYLVNNIGWTLVHWLWQGLAIAALGWAGLFLARKRSANVRYCLALAAMLAISVAPIATYCIIAEPAPLPVVMPEEFVPDFNITTTVSYAPAPANFRPVEMPVEIAPPPPAPAPARPVLEVIIERIQAAMPWCVALWLAGVVGLSIWHLSGFYQLQRLRRMSTKAVPDSVMALARSLADRLKIKRAVLVTESLLVQVPTVIGWLKPVILLPATAITGLDELQLQAMLAHELAHIRRCDYLVNICQTIIETLGFYHPAIWWLSRQIRIERENCCDDIAVAVVQSKKQYAAALFTMEAIRSKQRELAMAANGGKLIHRIERLANKETPTPRSWLPPVITAALLLIMGIGLAAYSNAYAGNDDNKPDVAESVDDGISDTDKNSQKMPETEDEMFAAMNKQQELIKDFEQNEKQAFYDTYILADNQNLKLVSPPFIPERMSFYKAHDYTQWMAIPEGPSVQTISWDGEKLTNGGLIFCDGFNTSLHTVLTTCLSVGVEQIVGVDEVMTISLPGDWVLRKGISDKTKLEALHEIILKKLGRDISFTKKQFICDTIIVSGTYDFKADKEYFNKDRVVFYSDAQDTDSGAGGSTAFTVNEMVMALARITGLNVVDNTTNTSEKINRQYDWNHSSWINGEQNATVKQNKLNLLLNNFSKQTNLTFRIEKRPVSKWLIYDKAKYKNDQEALAACNELKDGKKASDTLNPTMPVKQVTIETRLLTINNLDLSKYELPQVKIIDGEITKSELDGKLIGNPAKVNISSFNPLADQQKNAIIDFTKKDTKSRMLNAPHVTVFDNTLAYISFSKEFIYINPPKTPPADTLATAEDAADTIVSGIEINITPKMLENKAVNIKGDISITIPTYDNNNITGTIAVKADIDIETSDKQNILLILPEECFNGGILDEQTTDKKTICLLITPTVIMTADEAKDEKKGTDHSNLTHSIEIKDVINNIKKNDSLINNIQTKTTVFQIIDGKKHIFWDVEWGYDRGKEYFEGNFAVNLGDEGVGGYKGRQLPYHKSTFDGSKQYNLMDLTYMEENASSKVTGGIVGYSPNYFRMRENIFQLMGRSSQHNNDTLAEMLEKADSIAIKDEIEIINGHNCCVVEAIGIESNKSKYNHRYWLDIERGFLPLKRQIFRQDEYREPWDILYKEVFDIELSQIDGVWLPVKGKFMYYSAVQNPPVGMSEEEFINKYKDEPLSVVANAIVYSIVPSEKLKPRLVTISDIKINQEIPLEKFRIIFPNGCIVWDEFLQLGYTVGEEKEIKGTDPLNNPSLQIKTHSGIISAKDITISDTLSSIALSGTQITADLAGKEPNAVEKINAVGYLTAVDYIAEISKQDKSCKSIAAPQVITNNGKSAIFTTCNAIPYSIDDNNTFKYFESGVSLNITTTAIDSNTVNYTGTVKISSLTPQSSPQYSITHTINIDQTVKTDQSLLLVIPSKYLDNCRLINPGHSCYIALTPEILQKNDKSTNKAKASDTLNSSPAEILEILSRQRNNIQNIQYKLQVIHTVDNSENHIREVEEADIAPQIKQEILALERRNQQERQRGNTRYVEYDYAGDNTGRFKSIVQPGQINKDGISTPELYSQVSIWDGKAGIVYMQSSDSSSKGDAIISDKPVYHIERDILYVFSGHFTEALAEAIKSQVEIRQTHNDGLIILSFVNKDSVTIKATIDPSKNFAVIGQERVYPDNKKTVITAILKQAKDNWYPALGKYQEFVNNDLISENVYNVKSIVINDPDITDSYFKVEDKNKVSNSFRPTPITATANPSEFDMYFQIRDSADDAIDNDKQQIDISFKMVAINEFSPAKSQDPQVQKALDFIASELVREKADPNSRAALPILNKPQIAELTRTLTSQPNSCKIIAAPRVIVSDNEEAILSSSWGSKIIANEQENKQEKYSNSFWIKVKPTIHPENFITMDWDMELTAYDKDPAGNIIPDKKHRHSFVSNILSLNSSTAIIPFNSELVGDLELTDSKPKTSFMMVTAKIDESMEVDLLTVLEQIRANIDRIDNIEYESTFEIITDKEGTEKYVNNNFPDTTGSAFNGMVNASSIRNAYLNSADHEYFTHKYYYARGVGDRLDQERGKYDGTNKVIDRKTIHSSLYGGTRTILRHSSSDNKNLVYIVKNDDIPYSFLNTHYTFMEEFCQGLESCLRSNAECKLKYEDNGTCVISYQVGDKQTYVGYCDPKRNFLVTKWEKYSGENKTVSYNPVFKNFDGIWFPVAGEMIAYVGNKDEEVRSIYIMTVEEIKINVPNFDKNKIILDIPKGAHVVDVTAGSGNQVSIETRLLTFPELDLADFTMPQPQNFDGTLTISGLDDKLTDTPENIQIAEFSSLNSEIIDKFIRRAKSYPKGRLLTAPNVTLFDRENIELDFSKDFTTNNPANNSAVTLKHGLALSITPTTLDNNNIQLAGSISLPLLTADNKGKITGTKTVKFNIDIVTSDRQSVLLILPKNCLDDTMSTDIKTANEGTFCILFKPTIISLKETGETDEANSYFANPDNNNSKIYARYIEQSVPDKVNSALGNNYKWFNYYVHERIALSSDIFSGIRFNDKNDKPLITINSLAFNTNNNTLTAKITYIARGDKGAIPKISLAFIDDSNNIIGSSTITCPAIEPIYTSVRGYSPETITAEIKVDSPEKIAKFGIFCFEDDMATASTQAAALREGKSPSNSTFANTEYSFEEIRESTLGHEEKVMHIDKILEANPQHPQILEIKYYRAGQILNISKEVENYKYAISEFRKVLEEAGEDSEIGFKCQIIIGKILYHYLGDYEASYKHYKSLENLPLLSQHNLESDCKRLQVYERIVSSARMCRNGKLDDEIEKYARAVMEYPYVAIQDRELNERFSETYSNSAFAFVKTFKNDPEKLMSIEIFSSYTRICDLRQKYIENIHEMIKFADEYNCPTVEYIGPSVQLFSIDISAIDITGLDPAQLKLPPNDEYVIASLSPLGAVNIPSTSSENLSCYSGLNNDQTASICNLIVENNINSFVVNKRVVSFDQERTTIPLKNEKSEAGPAIDLTLTPTIQSDKTVRLSGSLSLATTYQNSTQISVPGDFCADIKDKNTVLLKYNDSQKTYLLILTPEISVKWLEQKVSNTVTDTIGSDYKWFAFTQNETIKLGKDIYGLGFKDKNKNTLIDINNITFSTDNNAVTAKISYYARGDEGLIPKIGLAFIDNSNNIIDSSITTCPAITIPGYIGYRVYLEETITIETKVDSPEKIAKFGIFCFEDGKS